MFVEVLGDPVQCAAEIVCGCDSFGRRLDELRLASVSVRCDDHVAGNPVGYLCTVIEPDEMDDQIDGRGHPGRGEDVAVVDVQDIVDDIDVGIVQTKLAGDVPVAGRTPPVKKTRCSEREGTHAQRDDAYATPMSGLQGVYNRW